MAPKGKNQIVTEIVIEATRSDVWRVLIDLESYSAWNPFVTRSIGEVKVGSTLQNTMMNGEKPIVVKPVITDVQEGRRFEWLGKALFGTFKGRHYFELEDARDGFTRLIHGEVFSGLIAPIVMPLVREETEKQIVAMNRALRDRLQPS